MNNSTHNPRRRLAYQASAVESALLQRRADLIAVTGTSLVTTLNA
jgi:hypothetical protein